MTSVNFLEGVIAIESPGLYVDIFGKERKRSVAAQAVSSSQWLPLSRLRGGEVTDSLTSAGSAGTLKHKGDASEQLSPMGRGKLMAVLAERSDSLYQ